MKFKRHVFICVNERAASDPRGCCAQRGSAEVAKRFKILCHERGLKGVVRVNKAECLDACEHGPSIVVYPEGVWYAGVGVDDVEEIIESHILGGQPVQRLLTPGYDMTPTAVDDLYKPIEPA